MARPQNKQELLKKSQRCYDQLVEMVDSYSPREQVADFPPGTLNRNMRDVLAHLYHWQQMFLGWHEVGMQGGKPEMPARGYSWKQTPELNKVIWQKYQGISLASIRKKLAQSHGEIHELINRYSNDQLFTRKKYPWTGSTSLGAYLVSATSSHYEWGLKLIKKCKG